MVRFKSVRLCFLTLAMSSTLALLTNRPILLRNKVATGFQRHIHWGLSYELTAASPRPSGRDKKVLLSNPRVDNESNQKYADELADLQDEFNYLENAVKYLQSIVGGRARTRNMPSSLTRP